MSDVDALILFAAVVLYAVFAGADFGAGFWDLTAGGERQGRRPRELIEHSIGPVWEANHVWLVFGLVVLWTAFPTAFAAILSTLYIPLGLAALGIVLRGSGFAFRKQVRGLAARRLFGVMFAASSVLTPFFLGTVAGGVASGRVTIGARHGSSVTTWLNPTALLGGSLAVLACAYLAAVFLVAEARKVRDAELERWFRMRAFAAAGAAGVIALGGIAILHADAHHLFERLLGPGLPLVIVSGACGVATLLLHERVSPRLLRLFGVGAVATIVLGWGVAQYPYLLGTHLKLSEAAAPRATLWSVAIVFAVAVLLCGPSLLFLYVLQQRGELESG